MQSTINSIRISQTEFPEIEHESNNPTWQSPIKGWGKEAWWNTCLFF